MTDVVLAHQGGWDESLLVAVPMGVFAALLWVAKRRAEREAEADEATAAAGGDSPR